MTGNLRYLAIDDDPAFLLVLGRMMEALGRETPLTASSGSEGLALLSDPARRIDCVLLDIQMPGMDGIETCRRVRAIRRHRDTPVMMITTMQGRSYVDEAFSAGATDYLTKPLDRIELAARLGMLERLVAERRRARTLEAEVAVLSDDPTLRLDFADAVELRDCDPAIDLLALKNYLLTLGRLNLYGQMAVGFRIVGAAQAFARLRPVEFLDYLCDAGEAIAGALKRFRFKLAYAGKGEFVACLNRTDSFDSREVESEIAQQMARFAPLYEGYPARLPAIVVGQPVSTGIFSLRSAETLIERALDALPVHAAIGLKRNRLD